MKKLLSDGSEYTFYGEYQSLQKYVIFSGIEFWVHKFPLDQQASLSELINAPYPYHIYTINAKIGEVYYMVMLNDNLEITVQTAEVNDGRSLMPCDFGIDPNLFVGATQLARFVDFNHPEIIKALGDLAPNAGSVDY